MTQTIHSRLSLVLLGVLLFPVAATTPAQSLGEVARQCRKEREAREKKGKFPVKVFTNDDIARMPPIAILKSSMQATSSPEMEPSPPSPPPEAANGGAQAGAPSAASGKAMSREKSKEYWQARFRAARARLTHAKEEQTLVEDELRLLQVQQARELNPERSRKLNGRIDASTVELEAKSAATEKAQRAMDQLEKEFKESGAPQEWIQKDPTAAQ
ncbi:MAG: hypothetical protein WB819_09030 [Terriglobia bacterium]